MNESKESTLKTFFVKLFHPADTGVPCKFQGVSDRFNLSVDDKNKLRGAIEGSDHIHFKGDKCKQCGVLAKVFIDEIKEEPLKLPLRVAEG